MDQDLVCVLLANIVLREVLHVDANGHQAAAAGPSGVIRSVRGRPGYAIDVVVGLL
jgi:hypothetical protein